MLACRPGRVPQPRRRSRCREEVPESLALHAEIGGRKPSGYVTRAVYHVPTCGQSREIRRASTRNAIDGLPAANSTLSQSIGANENAFVASIFGIQPLPDHSRPKQNYQVN